MADDRRLVGNRVFSDEIMFRMHPAALGTAIGKTIGQLIDNVVTVAGDSVIRWDTLEIGIHESFLGTHTLHLDIEVTDRPLATNVADMQAIVEQLVQEPRID